MGQRAARIQQFMWDEKAGLYFDYDFERKRRSGYHFITTFYPLWAGLATPEQAARVAANLPVFERDGGLMTSERVSELSENGKRQLSQECGATSLGFRIIKDQAATLTSARQ